MTLWHDIVLAAALALALIACGGCKSFDFNVSPTIAVGDSAIESAARGAAEGAIP